MLSFIKIRFYLIFFLLFYLNAIELNSQIIAKNGMVVSDSDIASQIGIDVLKKGGNAIDAVTATAFALAVTFPAAGNIGGGGFIIYLNSKNKVTSIDFREKAPILASEKMFQNETGDLIYNSNHKGVKAIGVPGTVDGLYYAHKKYGTIPWNELVQPAINLARNGFIMTIGLFNSVNNRKFHPTQDFLKNYFNNPQKKIVKPGEIWIQKALSETLISIRDEGRNGFYDGWVADEIVEFMKKNNGLITHKDLKNYNSVERDPIKGDYKGYKIYSMPPPSSGGVTLISMLNMLEQIETEKINFDSTKYFHLLIEIMRIGFFERAKYLGDPDFNLNMPIEKLTSKVSSKTKFKLINQNKASKSLINGINHPNDGENTTHISVVDKFGGAVSLTYTLESSFGSGMGSTKLGFIFNNEMGDFNPVAGLTTEAGLIGTSPNLIEPEKRMLSSMTPTIVTKNKKPYLIIGSPGGRTIINTVFQTIANVLLFNMGIKEAIEAPKIHHQWFPDNVRFEKNKLSDEIKNKLILMGHNLIGVEQLGNLMGILFDEKNKYFIGASDSASSDGAAIGY